MTLAAAATMCFAAVLVHAADLRPWAPDKINGWYAAQRWLLGSNYVPASAVNQLEMWQADSFDPSRIDRELGWAQKLGMNTQRVFLHDLLWQQDSVGFTRRINQFLEIAARHKIKPVFVLFDSCWDPAPLLGPQRPPIPGVHNSGWVQSPSAADLANPGSRARLRDYVEGVVGAFAKDERILAWDVWNEPPDVHSGGDGFYDSREAKDKYVLIVTMLPQVFAWVRSQTPIQPLTSGLWNRDHLVEPGALNSIEKIQIAESDFLSFHNYDWPEAFEKIVAHLATYERPVVCTEYLARSNGSTIDSILPIARRLNVGMINWGLVEGKTQTRLPWDSWTRPYILKEPAVWFHDLLHADGTPYREREAELMRALSQSSSSASASR